MLQIEEAQELLRNQVTRITETEQVPLGEASGRILAEDIIADRDQPPFPRSPLDGYAVRAEDLKDASQETPVRLRVIGKIYAGDVFDGVVGHGEAVRLMTGAPIPEGADTVIRQEDTRVVGACDPDGESRIFAQDGRVLSKQPVIQDKKDGMLAQKKDLTGCFENGKEETGRFVQKQKDVDIYVSSQPYKNYCFQGEDYKAGTVLLKKNAVLDAGKICVMASVGRAEVTVYRRPRVAVLSTGDEVLVPGTPWQPGKIYDSNRAYICTRLLEAGNPAAISCHVADDAGVVADAVRKAAASCDFVITTGGVSVGEKDVFHEVAKLLHAEKLFWKVQIKPGSPTMAFVCDGTPVLCLSGNPFGAIANFELLARPVLAVLTGNENWILQTKQAILWNDYKKPAGTRRFLRGFIKGGKVTVNTRLQASGAILSMADCNCLIEIPPDAAGACAGDTVCVYLL